MLISSKGRYALKLMIYIAAIGGDPVGESKKGTDQTRVSLREVAEREGISLKYLEQLVRPLMNAGLLRSVRGKGGGYVLAKSAAEVRAGDILRAAEGERSTVACEGLDGTCGRMRSVRGKGGGYVLAKSAAEVRAGDILRAAEGERSTVACEGLDGTCGRSDLCSTVKFWTGLEETIEAYVDGVTLAELAHVPEISIDVRL